MSHANRYSYVGPAAIREQAIAVDAVVCDLLPALVGWLAGRQRGDSPNPSPSSWESTAG